jgi:hypothetical protein
MTYSIYLYTWIYYCNYQYLSINFETKKKVPKFRLNTSDFHKVLLAMSSKYKNLFMVFFEDFCIAYLLKPFLQGHVLN